MRMQKGFTLVEILVALAVFLTISVAAIGAFVSLSARSQETRFISELQSVGDYALSLIEEDVKYAEAIGCGAIQTDCEGGSTLHIGSKGTTVYRYVVNRGVLYRELNGVQSGITAVIGDNQISVTQFRVTVTGSDASSKQQPAALVTLHIEISNPDGRSREVRLQRYMTVRELKL
jgi:prepilin-type N-terminal cleavage/methylation domain-containing protein